jgi:predicted AlkP superfamily phosphohydrolase/phosphomutase
LTIGLPAEKIYAAKRINVRRKKTKKVIVIGIDGMDPILSEQMMNAGQLPNFDKLRKLDGYRHLRTSIPPQSPVAWANFITGAGPGVHGIFDFVHRDAEKQCIPFFSIAHTMPPEGYLAVGNRKIQLTFWPFNHKPRRTELGRKGTPFWNYLDEAGIVSKIYDIPSNFPPSRSEYGNHYCLAGLGTPDMSGSYGTYQHFAENGPILRHDLGGGICSALFFENNTANLLLAGPPDIFLRESHTVNIPFVVHRDAQADAALIEIQNKKILLKKGQRSKWTKLDFELTVPGLSPNHHISGICYFYLQEVTPNFRLYVSPVNYDPSDPAIRISEPRKFCKDLSEKLGLFYTTGFKEAYKARIHDIFTDAEYAAQSDSVLTDRLAMLKYALDDFEDGLLFFYFSSTDLQSHIFWWNSNKKHPFRSNSEASKYFAHIKELYRKIDHVMGDILNRYGQGATIIALSDHGFASFGRQFNLNTWLRDNGYLQPAHAGSVLEDADWSATRAYGLGINGLYVNLKGRERDGIVEPGAEREQLLQELIGKLEFVRDVNGQYVIHKVHRTDRVYIGPQTQFAPDLIIGYSRGYRASQDTTLGDISQDVLCDNNSAWSADHCADVTQVPGVVFCNRPIHANAPALVDLAPSILAEYGLKTPPSMSGKNIFAT